MSARGAIMGAALLCVLMGLFSPAQSLWRGGSANGCCLSYSRRPVPFTIIKGYREQTDLNNCHIEAIIFYTTRKTQICATRKDGWVKRVLKQLSSKLKKMSKEGEGHLKKRVRNDGSGLFAPTNTFQTTPSTSISKKK